MLSKQEFFAVSEAIRKEQVSLDRLRKARPLYETVVEGQKDVLSSALTKLRGWYETPKAGSKE